MSLIHGGGVPKHDVLGVFTMKLFTTQITGMVIAKENIFLAYGQSTYVTSHVIISLTFGGNQCSPTPSLEPSPLKCYVPDRGPVRVCVSGFH